MRDYRERLYVPLAWWLLAVPIVLILGGTLYAGLPWPWPIVIIGGLGAGCAARGPIRRHAFTRDPTSRNPYTWPSIRRPRGIATSPTG